MVSYKKLYLVLIGLFINNVCSSVDHKCDNGEQMTVLWWSQEPYIFTLKERDLPSLEGMFPVILSKMIKSCCNINTTVNYTKISEGPTSLDKLLGSNNFDVIIPVGGNVGAESVRQFPFVGVLESPGVAVLIKGNVSGTQLLLSVLQGWPILVFILISATLVGVIIWLVVSEIILCSLFRGVW